VELSLRPSLRQICRCAYCNWDVNDHDPECPVAQVEALYQIVFEICCPKCSQHELALSDADFWQCYSCNVVMTCQGYLGEADEVYYIDHHRLDDSQLVRVIPNAEPRPRKFEHVYKQIEALEAEIDRLSEEL